LIHRKTGKYASKLDAICSGHESDSFLEKFDRFSLQKWTNHGAIGQPRMALERLGEDSQI
jgi:hypothetical protein